MQELKKRVAYLQGLAEGLRGEEISPQEQVLQGILDVLENLTDIVAQMREAQEDLEEYVYAVDDDLSDLEEDFYEPEDDEEEQWEPYEDGEDEEEEAIHFVQLKCSRCGETVFVDDHLFSHAERTELDCPGCKHTIVVEEPRAGRDEGK